MVVDLGVRPPTHVLGGGIFFFFVFFFFLFFRYSLRCTGVVLFSRQKKYIHWISSVCSVVSVKYPKYVILKFPLLFILYSILFCEFDYKKKSWAEEIHFF
jgi:hypothetical protein